MKGLLRTLAILACMMLAIQTVRHTYLLWFASRTSVLTQYDRPLAGEIDAAGSLDELVRRYDPIRKEADRVRAERRASPPSLGAPVDEYNVEPFKSERQLHEAIVTWERRAATVRALRYYWSVGLVFAVLGLLSYRRRHRWLGITLAVIGLAEMIYWTSPEFFSTFTGGDAEFDRLLINKLILSLVTAVALAVAIRTFHVFEETVLETEHQ